MSEENSYIGIVKTVHCENQADSTALITPLMKWSIENGNWFWHNIEQKELNEMFQIKLDVWWSNIPDQILEGQVLKFSISENEDFRPSLSTTKAGSKQNRKFVVSSAHSVCELFEMKATNSTENESKIRSDLIKEGLPSKPFCNSQVFVSINDYSWLGPLEFITNQHNNRLCMIVDDSYLKAIPVYRIPSDLRIIPKSLRGRFFIDPDEDFGEIIDYRNWQPDNLFFSSLTEILRKIDHKSFKIFDLNLQNFDQYLEQVDYSNLPEKDIIIERNKNMACRYRLKELKDLKLAQKRDIEMIAKTIMNMDGLKNVFNTINKETGQETNIVAQFEKELSDLRQEKANLEVQLTKELTEIRRQNLELIEQEYAEAKKQTEIELAIVKEHINQEIAQIFEQKTDLELQTENMEKNIENLCQIIIDNEAEIESKKLEKICLDGKILDTKNEFNKLEKSLELQRTGMNQVLDKFEQSLTHRLDQIAIEPTSMLAEALANDAFLQLIFGKKHRLLESTSSIQSSSNMPVFEIKKGAFFKNIEALITKYCSHLERVDLDKSLAAWTLAISLSGHIPVFKGHALRRALNVLTNHLTFGRCFDLPLSPEIISIERLFTIGQSDSPSNSGILDTAILYAATHREVLFFLVLGGLDRAPSQYFLDTLLDWYGRGLLDIPGDTFLSQRLEKLWKQHHVWEQQSLADDVLGWPPNLLLTATISGLADGFQISGAMQGQLIEVNAESQGKHLDIHPALIDQNAHKLAGEITVNQWNEWREKAQHQDVSFMANFIRSLPKDEQPDRAKQEAALRIFAALCALDQHQDDALKIIQQYLLKSV